MKRFPGLLVILIALGANAWMLALEFQFCDYEDIRDVGWMIGAEPTPHDVPWTTAIRARVYSWRPALWAVLFGLLKVSAGHAEPWVFHLFFLSAHAIASFLLYRILNARAGRIPGMIGGALFAILPGGIHAVSWITAGGDQLVVLFMLIAGVASDEALRRRSGLGVVACGLATFCAVSSKEPAVVLLPALAMLWVIPPADALALRGRRKSLALAAAAGAAGAWILRAWALGAWLPEYWAGARPALSQLSVLPTAFRGFLLPWDPGTLPDGMAPCSAVLLGSFGLGDDLVSNACILSGAVGLVLPLAIGFTFATRSRRLAMLALSALLVFVVLPVLPLTTRTGLGMSRALYPASLMLAALVGSSVPGLATRSRWLLATLLPFVLFSLDLLVLVAHRELEMASAIHAARADLDGIVARSSGTRLVLLQPPEWIGSVPFVGGGLADAVCPPFGSASRPPLVWPGAETLKRCPVITGESSPAQILEWNGRHVVARGPLLAAIPKELPLLEEDRAIARTFRPRTAVPPRAIAGIEIELLPSSRPSTGVATLIAGGRTRSLRFDAAGAGSHVVAVPDDAFDEPWFREPTLDGVQVDGPGLARSPVLLRTLPAIVVLSPETGQFSLRSTPRISFSSAAPAAFFRVTIECVVGDVLVPLCWLVSASGVGARGDGRYDFVADGSADVVIGGRVVERLNWNEIAARLAPYAHGRLWQLLVELRVEGLDASRANTIARSEWLPLAVVR